jgi:hypothetical protein
MNTHFDRACSESDVTRSPQLVFKSWKFMLYTASAFTTQPQKITRDEMRFFYLQSRCVSRDGLENALLSLAHASPTLSSADLIEVEDVSLH